MLLNVKFISFTLLLFFQGVHGLDDETRLGLIVGCAVGGVVLLVVITLCCCVIHRKTSDDKTKHLPKHSQNGTTPVPSSQVPVPPGIWSTSPTMVAVSPPGPGYGPPPSKQGGHSPPTQEDVKRPKRLPRAKDREQATQQPKPRWQKTLSRAHRALKQIPAVFQVKTNHKQTLAFKREHENTQDRQAKRDSRESRHSQEVGRGRPDGEDRPVSGQEVNGGGHGRISPQPPMTSHLPQNSLTSTLPPPIEETDEDDSSPGAPVGPFVAKAYSNYKKKSQPDPVDSNVARAFSSYTNINSHRDPYQARANIRKPAPPAPNLISQSDAFLHRKGRPVSRTHSDLSHAKAGGPKAPFVQRPYGPVGGSWNPYGQGVVMRSQGWQGPQVGPGNTQSLDRKPKAVFAPKLNNKKQENQYLWKASESKNNLEQPKASKKTPPKRPLKPVVPKRGPSARDREAPKKMGQSTEHVAVHVKGPIPKPGDVQFKANKSKDMSPAEGMGQNGTMPVTKQHQSDHATGERPAQEGVVVRDGADPEQRNKSAGSTTDVETNDGKEITADAFKFLDEYL